MLEVNGIGKRFLKDGREVVALENINLELNKGDFLSLIGLNGAGKTTLMRILTGVLTPDEGNVKILGMSYQNNEKEIKKRLGVVMGSEHSIYGKLTAMENLKFFSSFYDVSDRRFKVVAPEILKYLDLYDKKDVQVENFSKGMKQKMLIAKALLHKSDMLILDEPSNGIDVISNLKFKDLLRDLNKRFGKTIIMTTHNLADAEDLGNKLCILQKGKIVKNGLFEDVYKSYFKSYIITVRLKNRINDLDIIRRLEDVLEIKEYLEEGKYCYDVIYSNEGDEKIGFLLDSMDRNDLIGINEKNISLEYLLKSMVNENEKSN